MPAPRPLPKQLHSLRQAGSEHGYLHALMDASLTPELPEKLIQHKPQLDYLPLFLGDEAASLAAISPYLMRLEFDDPLLWWLLDEGADKAWGIYLCSNAELTALHHHLFSLLAVRDLQGDTLWFRYYDPRVLKPFWRALNDEEKNRFLGPIECLIILDTPQQGLWAYQRPQGKKQPDYPPAPEDWNSLPEPWWQLTQTQHKALVDGFMHTFLHRFADHLAKTRDQLKPGYQTDFHSDSWMKHLSSQAQYFMQHGFETEYQLAQALEYVVVFGLAVEDKDVKAVVENRGVDVDERLRVLRGMTRIKVW